MGISRSTITYVSVVREAKAVQVWNGNVGALILYPNVGSSLAAQFLVNGARVFGFGKLVWHRTAKDQVLVEAGRPYFHRYTHIKAPPNPLVLCFDNTSISIAQSQVMSNDGLDRCSLIPELLIELSPCSRVCCFIDDVGIFLQGRLVSEVLPIIELESSWHGERGIPRHASPREIGIEIWLALADGLAS